jgi:Arc/MetJ family transcription regulator
MNDDCVRSIMDRYRVRTTTEAVDLALRHLAGEPMSRAEARAMRGAGAILERPRDTSSVDLDEASLRA